MAERGRIRLTVNGDQVELDVDPTKRLVDLLRDDLRLTGTKVGCEIGVCGACTVLLDDEPVSGCLTLAFQAKGRSVRTIEGLALGGSLHPVQQAFMETGAFQCGFCTPGQIMAAVALLERVGNPTDDDIREGITGNLCRCTGYYPIAAAIRSAAARGATADAPRRMGNSASTRR
jgi:carbon-monoxide dehydrogenase small subunit